MTLIMDITTDTPFSFSCEEIAKKVITEALKRERFPENCEVSLLITDAEEVHRLNKEYRDIDRTTDVLSFPLLDLEEPGILPEDILSDPGSVDPENGALMLGDIVINTQRVISQAEEYGHSPLREYAFLIAHSMLHLMGYDHMEEEERSVMEGKQEEILTALQITRV